MSFNQFGSNPITCTTNELGFTAGVSNNNNVILQRQQITPPVYEGFKDDDGIVVNYQQQQHQHQPQILNQSIPSPPCSIPEQTVYNQQPQHIINIPSPTNALMFDNNTATAANSLGIIANNAAMNALGEQQSVFNNANIALAGGFTGNDAAATMAAAEHHMMVNMIQEQHFLQQQHQQQQHQHQHQQQQEQLQHRQHQQHLQQQHKDINHSNAINSSVQTHTINNTDDATITSHHVKNKIDPHQFDDMSREELIARLVELEKEKHHIVDNSDTEHEEEEEAEAEDEEEESVSITEQPQIRTCNWANCGEKFDVLQRLISHIAEAHVGGGKPTYRCEWENCARNNKPFTKRHKMYNHLRTHTGERPFACPKPDCEKKFSRPDSLTTHIKTHSNVRPFVCQYKGCGKAYYHSRSLKKHEKLHEENTVSSPLLQIQMQQPVVQQQHTVIEQLPSYEQSIMVGQAPNMNSFVSNTAAAAVAPVDPIQFYQQSPQQTTPMATQFPFSPFSSTTSSTPSSVSTSQQYNTANYMMNTPINPSPIIQNFANLPPHHHPQ